MYAKINTETQSSYLLKKKIYNCTKYIINYERKNTQCRYSYNPNAQGLTELQIRFKTQKAIPAIVTCWNTEISTQYFALD